MKKILTMLMTLILLATAVPLCYADAGIPVTVTIANGTLKLKQRAVSVTDADNDGKITINDALILAHTAYYPNGASGYAAETGDYGLCIKKLWGAENGSGFGYYVNHKAATGLSDPIKAGDVIDAYIYTDTVAFSDVYCYFNVDTIDAKAGESVTLTLTAAAFDENWNPIEKPVVGAAILLDGIKTDAVTDANGNATLTLTSSAVISAISGTQTLVPPVCRATVVKAGTEQEQAPQKPSESTDDKTGEAAPKTADPFVGATVFLLAAALATALTVQSKRTHG